MQGNRSKNERDILITAAAGLFVQQGRDANLIADSLGTTPRTIYRWSKTDKWAEVLDALGYDGELNFRVRKAGRPRKN